MKLYVAGPSPFVRKVLVLIHETGQSDEIEMVTVVAAPSGSDATLLAMNPLGKIPALERLDGPTIYDSRVITRYLDAKSGAGLYPAGDSLWEVLTLEATADGIMDAAVLMVYEKRFRDEAIWSQDWLEAQWSKVARGLDAIEARWMAHLAGPLSMAQIAVGVALGYLDFRHGDRDWRAGRPALAEWEARFAERPSMLATKPQ